MKEIAFCVKKYNVSFSMIIFFLLLASTFLPACSEVHEKETGGDATLQLETEDTSDGIVSAEAELSGKGQDRAHTVDQTCRILILNGTLVDGAAMELSDQLSTIGYQDITVGNFSSIMTYYKYLITYEQDLYVSDANKIKDFLSVDNGYCTVQQDVLGHLGEKYDLLIVIGDPEFIPTESW